MVKRKKGVTSKLPVKRARERRVSPRPIPEGKFELVITYLEMTAHPRHSPPHPGQKIALLLAESPPSSFYRYLCSSVGERWLRHERRELSDEELRKIIHDAAVQIFVLYVRGVPAGYFELDARVRDEVELADFGLIPEFSGRGLESFLLSCAVDKAWSKEPRRVWVRARNLDYPRAVSSYQRAGFVPYDQETLIIDDPRG